MYVYMYVSIYGWMDGWIVSDHYSSFSRYISLLLCFLKSYEVCRNE